jgi:SAM-dependent methyltransferase
MTHKQKYLKFIDDLLSGEEGFKLIFSKPRKEIEARSETIEIILDNKVRSAQSVKRTLTQHFTSVIELKDLKLYLDTCINDHYFYCEIFSGLGNAVLLQNNKGTTTFIQKKQTTTIHAKSHNKKKDYAISEDAPFLRELGLSSTQGKVYEQSQKKYRQINKFIEIVQGLLPPSKDLWHIADMGCGKAYLTFALYHYIAEVLDKNVIITGYDIRPELIAQCNDIAQKLGYKNLSFKQANIEETILPPTDLLIALHACDIATDMAIYQGIVSGAHTIVVAPCCHKQIRKQIQLRNGILKHGILLERTAEMVTDAIRSLILEDHGYKSKIFEFINTEHTQKNTMIAAQKIKRNENAAIEIKDIKENYGIHFHYLEKLVEKSY